MSQLKLSATGAAGAAGTLALSFPSVPSQQYWLCAVVVPSVPVAMTGTVFVDGQARFPLAGPQPSALVEVGGGSTVSVVLQGLTPGAQVTALVLGGAFYGTPPGTVPSGPSTVISTAVITGPVTVEGKVTIGTVQEPVTVKVKVLPPPVVATVGILSVRVKLLGTTTAVAIVPATRTQVYFENCKIGFVIWGTPTNTGKRIYLGDAAGGVSVTDASIPAGATKLVGAFSVAFGNAVTMRISGKTGDYANVWAA